MVIQRKTRQRKMAVNKASATLCRLCKKVVKENEKSILCDAFCVEQWFHAKCANISSTDYQKISELGDLSRWYCPDCDSRLDQCRNSGLDPANFIDFTIKLNDMDKRLEVIDSFNNELFVKFESLIDMKFKTFLNSNTIKLNDMDKRLEVIDSFNNELFVKFESLIDMKFKTFLNSTDNPELVHQTDSLNLNVAAGDCVNKRNISTVRRKSIVKIDLVGNTPSPSIMDNNRPPNRRDENKHCSNGITHVLNAINNDDEQSKLTYADNSEVNISTNNTSNEMQWSEVVNKRRRVANRQLNRTVTHQQVGKSNVNNELHVPNTNVSGSNIKRNKEEIGDKRGWNNRVIRGTMEAVEDGPLKVAKRMFWLFVSGLDSSVETSAVLSHLGNLKESTKFICEKINSKYDTYSSFKVGVPFELANELMHPNLWPQGCIVKRFRTRPRSEMTSGFLRPTLRVRNVT
jgi:hypothetical protein